MPGFPQVVANAWDVMALNSQGTRWLNNADGAQDHAYFIIPDSTVGNTRWGKTNGLGDLVALCDPAPMEIGNHIWLDANGNGIQDPNETGIAGVTVHLYRLGFGPDSIPGTPDDNAPLAIAVSDAYGDYYFDNGPGPDPLLDEVGIVTDNLKPGATYEIRLDKPADAQANGPLNGLTLTGKHNPISAPSGSTLSDSDADMVLNPVGSPLGAFAVITYTVGPPGAYDHTLDFGFTPSGVSVGNQVWFDTNANGQVDPQEVGIANVTVELFHDANADNSLTGAEQTAIATQQTTAEGFYLFTQDSSGHLLAPGNYVVGIAPTNFVPGGRLVGYLSSGTSITSNGSVTETVAPAANTNVDNDDNGQKQTTGFYAGGLLSSVISVFNDEPSNEVPGNKPSTLAGTTPGLNDPNRNNTSNLTVDFGFYQLFLGDNVFLDEGNNGLRDGSDRGVNNVNVRLCAADGVTEIPVGPDGLLGTADDAPGGVVNAKLGTSDGQYRFGGLPQGEYIVCLTPPAGFTSSTGNPLSQSSGPYEPGLDPDTLNSGKLINNDDNGAVVGSQIQSQPVKLVGGDPHLPNPSDINYQTGASLNNTVDFGLIRMVDVNLYSVGNRVWLDNGLGLHTNNGVIDSDERGAPNITVTLYATVTGVLTPVAQTQTDAAGYYRFSDLNPGDYIVQVTKPSGAIGCTNGVEADPNLDGDSNNNGVNDLGNRIRSQTITLGPGDSEPLNEVDLSTDGQGSLDARANMTLDFCFVLNHPLSLGNQVYQDHSNNGFFDPATDVGLAGVQVNLSYDLNGDGKVDEIEAATPYLTTTTTISGSSAGYYLFSNLPPGNFVVELPPSNFADGEPLAGYLSCSGKNGSIGGPYEPAHDPDDPRFEADTLDVGGAYLNPGTGAHSIRSLPLTLQPNTEPLRLTQPDGNGVLNDGILDPKEDPLFDNDPTSADGDSNLLVDFCVFKPYSLGNRVWFDANGNGLNDADEHGIANVVVSLYAVANTLVATTTTDALGYYRFDYLTAGDYIIDVATPTSPVTGQLMVSTMPDGNDPDDNPTDRDDNGVDLGTPGHVRSQPVTLGDANASDSEPTGETDRSPLAGPGEADDARANLTVDFGFYDPVNLGNHVFNDAENLCYRVSGQRTGLPGVQVYLYEDRNADSIPDGAAVMSQTTDLNGNYLFTNLHPGSYLAQVIPPPGFISSTGQQGSRANGPCEGADAPDPNAGPGGGIDNDDNGVTLPDGRIFSQPINLQSREENAQDESADANTNLTVDFGLFKPLGLGNLVWDDLNDDGLWDATEPGLDGVVVNLYYDGNFDGAVDRFELATPVSTTVTANDGQYLFQNLGRGGYVVELAPSNFTANGKLANYISSNGAQVGQLGPYEPAPDPNAEGGPNGNPIDNDDNGQAFTTATGGHTLLSQQVTLEAATEPLGEIPANAPDLPDPNANLTVDFGLYVPFSLGNRVWLDANNNGRIDTGENGVGNVQVNLYQSDGVAKVDSTLTAASGYYRFDGLRAGAYLVGIDAGNFVSPTETSSGALLNYLSSTSDKTNPTDPTDSLDNGVGNAPDPQNGVLSSALQLGPNGGAPLQETDLVTGTNPQGAPDSFANMTLDFGFYQPVCVGHRVWLDANKDGIQEENETGIAGVTVTLYRSDNTEVTHMATLADGNYQFCNLPPGDYYVQFTLPENYQLSPPDQGTGDTQDSDVDPTTGRTPVIPLQSGNFDLKWDAGIYIAPTALDETTEPTQVYRLFMPIAER